MFLKFRMGSPWGGVGGKEWNVEVCNDVSMSCVSAPTRTLLLAANLTFELLWLRALQLNQQFVQTNNIDPGCRQFNGWQKVTTCDVTRVIKLWGQKKRKVKRAAAALSRTQDTSGLSRQCSATEPRQLDNHYGGSWTYLNLDLPFEFCNDDVI